MTEKNQENNGKPKGFINKTIYFTGFTFGKIRNANNKLIKSLDWKEINSRTKDALLSAKEKSAEIAQSFKESTKEVAESFIAGIESVDSKNQAPTKQHRIITADKEISLNSTAKRKAPEQETKASEIIDAIDDVKLDNNLEKEIEKIDEAIQDI